MEQLNNKIDGTGLPENSLPATEWNQVPEEIQNVITNSGLALSSGDLNQLGKGIAHYAANGTFYTDGGAADAYVVSVIGTNQAPPGYINGMEINFIAANANTGGAATVNVAGLGVKSIKTRSGGDPVAGDIPLTVISKMIYDGTNFVIYTVTDASDTIAGLSERATAAECNALSDQERFVTPGRIPIASETQQGLAERATAAEANALSDTSRFIVPATIPIASETQQGLVERATQAEVDTGTDTTRYVSPATLEGKVGGSTITNYTDKGIVEHIFSANSSSPFDIDAVIGAAWESVGPTGSGATNIWTDLDVIPAGAAGVNLLISLQISGTTNLAPYRASIYFRKGGSTIGIGPQTLFSQASFINNSGSSENDYNSSMTKVSLDSNLRFEVYLFETGTGISTGANMSLVSIIE